MSTNSAQAERRPRRSARWRRALIVETRVRRKTQPCPRRAQPQQNPCPATLGAIGPMPRSGGRDVIELVEGLISDGKPTLANRVQSLVSHRGSHLRFDADLVEEQSVPSVEKARCRKRRPPCPVRRVKCACSGSASSSLAMNTAHRDWALRLALLTGARVGEIAGPSARAELARTSR